MADWTTLDTNTLLPGEPVTSAIMLALEENPRAIAGSAVGSPKIARKYLSGTVTDTGSGSITFTDLDPWSGFAIINALKDTGDQLSISFSDDGSTFVGSTNIDAGGFFHVDLLTGDYVDVGSGAATGTIATIPSPVTDVRLTVTQAGESVSLTVAIELTGGDSAE